MRHVARLRREGRGHVLPPPLAIIDTHCVWCICAGGPQGYEAGNEVTGRKRVMIVASDGAMLVTAVVPANLRDRDCLKGLTTGKADWPSLRLVDGAFTAGSRRVHGGALPRMVRPSRHGRSHRRT